MASLFEYGREAIRVKVKKCEGILQPEYRKFSVDPQITSFEVLQSILAKAFDIKGDFTVCYRAIDDYGQETYLSLLSDWDLDAAFLSASEPYLYLQVDMKPFEESSDDWDVVGTIDTTRTQFQESKLQNRLPGLIMNQVERTFNMVQRALNLVEDQQSALSNHPPRPPLADAEFRKFLDPIGQVVQSRELRSVIYLGGIDPSLRKVVWKHILNVYPDGMSGKERMDYMKKKAYEYQSLRDCWRNMIQNGQVSGELAYVTSMVRKDVLRTDRHHTFYAGSDDNQNIASLFNILTTYALNHPSVSYSQGMSDLASPLLVTMGDEAHAYICFCALMRRLQSNFKLDGVTMTLKFQHLAEGLMYYDPEFYSYLKSHQADDLLFCYRWLLLEMKREFAFDDALRMLEVLWSSIPQMPPDKDLALFEHQFCAQSPRDSPPPISPLLKTTRENAYTKVCALRRQSSSASLHSIANGSVRSRLQNGCSSSIRQNQSLDETVIGSNQNVLKQQGKVKPFASMDDASIRLGSCERTVKSRSLSPNEVLSEPENEVTNEVNNKINNKIVMRANDGLSVSTGNLLMSKSNDKKGFLNDLKEKFSSDKSKIIFSSLDKINTSESSKDIVNKATDSGGQVKVVKNLNEFLSFASTNKNRMLSEKISQNIQEQQEKNRLKQENAINNEDSENMTKNNDNPKITLTSDFEKTKEYGRNGESEENFDRITKTENILQKTKLNDIEDAFCESSSPDDSTEYFPMTTSMTRELRLELENLDRQVFGSKFNQRSLTLEDSEDMDSPCSESFRSVDVKIENGVAGQKCDCVLSKQESELPSDETTTEVAEICSAPYNKVSGPKIKVESFSQRSPQNIPDICSDNQLVENCSKDQMRGSLCLKLNRLSQNFSPGSTVGAGEEIFVWENPLQCPTTPDEQAELEYDGSVNCNDPDNCYSSAISGGEIFENEGQGVKSVTPIRLVRSGVGGGVYCQHRASSPDDASDSSDGWNGLKISNTQALPSSSNEQKLCSRVVPPLEKISPEMLSLARRRGSKEPFVTIPGVMTNSCEEVTEIPGVQSNVATNTNTAISSTTAVPSVNSVTKPPSPVNKSSQSSFGLQLPPPHKFGDGNPFLMFLCLTVLHQHRDFIMRSGMDYNEMAMHFDKMVRKHNVNRVLNHARQMYASYLRHQATLNNNTQSNADLNV